MAGKVTITAKNAKLGIRKSGGYYEIETINFRPSEQPNFTTFLEQTFVLKNVHNNKNKSGFYLVEITKDQKEDFLEILSNGLKEVANIELPCETVHTGTKK